MIVTLFITLIIESGVVVVYCLWRKKPTPPILLTSICGNLITQSFLWVVLNLFFQHYLVTLLIAELWIWISESLLLHFVPANRLGFGDAVFLSLTMNIFSLSAGWFL